MKKFLRKITIGAVLTATLFGFAACGGTQIAYGDVTRDANNIGGANLSFNYNDETYTATFGDDGEEVEYYAEGEHDFETAGNRVGITITVPEEVEDTSKARLRIGSTTLEDGEFIDETTNSVTVYPAVSATMKEVKIYIKWSEDTAEQCYTVKIANGTTFEAAPAA